MNVDIIAVSSIRSFQNALPYVNNTCKLTAKVGNGNQLQGPRSSFEIGGGRGQNTLFLTNSL